MLFQAPLKLSGSYYYRCCIHKETDVLKHLPESQSHVERELAASCVQLLGPHLAAALCLPQVDEYSVLHQLGGQTKQFQTWLGSLPVFRARKKALGSGYLPSWPLFPPPQGTPPPLHCKWLPRQESGPGTCRGQIPCAASCGAVAKSWGALLWPMRLENLKQQP